MLFHDIPNIIHQFFIKHGNFCSLYIPYLARKGLEPIKKWINNGVMKCSLINWEITIIKPAYFRMNENSAKLEANILHNHVDTIYHVLYLLVLLH